MNNILKAIRTTTMNGEEDALEVLKALMCKYPKNSLTGDAILDSVMVLENAIENHADLDQRRDDSWKERQEKAMEEHGGAA